jgi:hypothetical protein
LYEVSEPLPVTAPAVSTRFEPAHILVDDGVILATVGNGLTVTAGDITEMVLLQPAPG